MYHVSLDLTDDQKYRLKKAALEEGTTVKELVTAVVTVFLDKRSEKPAAGGGSRGRSPAKK